MTLANLRIGAVSYLNTIPLVYGLADRLPNARISYDLPSRLADHLHAGALDIALIPTIEFLQKSEDYEIVSNSCIACRGPVWSVRLLSRVPVSQIKTLALDEGSRTSAALVRILLNEQYGLSPTLTPLSIDSDPQDCDSDAVLIIGDRALTPSNGDYQEIWDLGDHWHQWSGLPFVFATWVGRRGECDSDIANSLNASRDDGLAQIENIANAEAQRHGLSVPDCIAYFTRYLHFDFGPDEQRGLDLFKERSAELGLLPQPA